MRTTSKERALSSMHPMALNCPEGLDCFHRRVLPLSAPAGASAAPADLAAATGMHRSPQPLLSNENFLAHGAKRPE